MIAAIRIHRNLYEQLQTTFGNGLFSTVIETDTKLRESSIAGLPIIESLPQRAVLQSNIGLWPRRFCNMLKKQLRSRLDNRFLPI
jgi:cellulose biosynthesis protein BcsQ